PKRRLAGDDPHAVVLQLLRAEPLGLGLRQDGLEVSVRWGRAVAGHLHTQTEQSAHGRDGQHHPEQPGGDRLAERVPDHPADRADHRGQVHAAPFVYRPRSAASSDVLPLSVSSPTCPRYASLPATTTANSSHSSSTSGSTWVTSSTVLPDLRNPAATSRSS